MRRLLRVQLHHVYVYGYIQKLRGKTNSDGTKRLRKLNHG